MALDGKHHLEGVLLGSGTFRVYLYDAFTHPLRPEQVRQARGTLQWGESPEAPEVPLQVAENAQYLEATPNDPVKFPLTLTLFLHLPGSPPEARPELFSFPFSHYTTSPTQGSTPAGEHPLDQNAH